MDCNLVLVVILASSSFLTTLNLSSSLSIDLETWSVAILVMLTACMVVCERDGERDRGGGEDERDFRVK